MKLKMKLTVYMSYSSLSKVKCVKLATVRLTFSNWAHVNVHEWSTLSIKGTILLIVLEFCITYGAVVCEVIHSIIGLISRVFFSYMYMDCFLQKCMGPKGVGGGRERITSFMELYQYHQRRVTSTCYVWLGGLSCLKVEWGKGRGEDKG